MANLIMMWLEPWRLSGWDKVIVYPDVKRSFAVSYGNGAGVESPWNTQAGVSGRSDNKK